MRISGRILSLVLSVVMLASVCLAAASCKVSKGEIKKVQETDPWYEAKRVELDPEFDASKTKNLKVKGPYLIRDSRLLYSENAEEKPPVRQRALISGPRKARWAPCRTGCWKTGRISSGHVIRCIPLWSGEKTREFRIPDKRGLLPSNNCRSFHIAASSDHLAHFYSYI